MTMEFLHARVHAPTLWLGSGQRPRFSAVRCPRCQAPYIAQQPADLEPWDREVYEYRAIWRLNRECPDHAHRFAVME